MLSILKLKVNYFLTLLISLVSVLIPLTQKSVGLKGHSACQGNDLADLLAHSAYLNNTIAYSTLPLQFVKTSLQQHLLQLWNNRWINDTKGQITHCFFLTIFHRLSIDFGEFYFGLTEFLTQHDKFNSYLNGFKILNDPQYNCYSGEPDTVIHIIFDCRLFDCWRRKLITHFHTQLTSWPIDLHLLFKDKDTTILTKKCFIESSAQFGSISNL